ncbi:MAG: cadherin-like beta sandwich domain-containing protein [Treponema sp.]|jgi:hypothetical protein|nr:cadherin-like beta sandwich domain-containing protein [Treponema sp.]
MYILKRKSPQRRVSALLCAALTAWIYFASCEQPGGVTLDSDAAFKSIAISAGTLTPAFSPSCLDYTVTVRNSIDSVTLDATANSPKASVRGTGLKTLSEGKNTLTLQAQAENGDTQTVTITVTRIDASVRGIESAEELAKIGVDPEYPAAGMYTLLNDITLENWTPICGDEPFSGAFNGEGHTITLDNFDDQPVGSIYVATEIPTTMPSSPVTRHKVFLGIFASVKGAQSAKAELKNFSVNANVHSTVTEDSGTAVGLVAAYGEYAVFEDIDVSGTFTFENKYTAYAGGVVGILRGTGTIVRNCASSVVMDITPGSGYPLIAGLPNPFSFTGGIAGYMEDGVGIENCHNSGDIKAVSAAGGSQFMAGGILGGTFNGFSDWYNGYITGCSSTGDITVGAMGFWPMAGGIAGIICGGHGSLENSTRITRSFATGTIKLASPPGSGTEGAQGYTGQWPYVGGIVGYVYFGAWVSQCYFDGNVIVNQAYDYTGGIAGYLSFATNNNGSPCVLEDCWSSGTVTGFNNAGGVVGQHQENSIVRRSYSRSAVSVTNGGTNNAAQWGIGGIAGAHFSSWPDDALSNCVALNVSIQTPRTANGEGSIHRIAGKVSLVAVLKNNWALPGLLPAAGDDSYTADKGADKSDGRDIVDNPAYLSGGKPTEKFYEEILGWDFVNIWKMGSDGYPKLGWQE